MPEPRAGVTNPDCTDGDETFCCIDHDGTGLWCDSCLSWTVISGDAASDESSTSGPETSVRG